MASGIFSMGKGLKPSRFGSRTQANSKAQVICIEVKSSKKWDRKWKKPIRSLGEEGKIDVLAQYGIYCGSEILERNTFKVLPMQVFFERLHRAEIF